MALPPPICNNIVTNPCYPSVLAASLAAFLWAAPLPASATALQFTLDTSSLSGTASLVFDFIGNDGDDGNNTITISDFFTDGTLGATDTQGGVAGTLSPGLLTLTDSDFFNVFLQELTFGSEIRFKLTLTQERVAGSQFPDSLAVYLLNGSDYFSSPPLFATTDRFGLDALFAVDIDGSSGGNLDVFQAVDANVTWIVAPVASIPLPSTALLIGAGLLGGLAARRRVVQVAS